MTRRAGPGRRGGRQAEPVGRRREDPSAWRAMPMPLPIPIPSYSTAMLATIRYEAMNAFSSLGMSLKLLLSRL